MNKLILLSCTLLFSQIIFAQSALTLKAGFNISEPVYSGNADLLGDISTAMASPSIGFRYQKNLDAHWSLLSGFDYGSDRFALGKSIDLRLFGIQLPVELRTELISRNLNIPIELRYTHFLNDWSVYASAGAGYQRSLSARVEPKLHALLEFNLPGIDIDLSSINRDQIFGGLNAGISRDFGDSSLAFEFGYRQSFESISPDFILDLNIKQRVMQLGLAYSYRF